MLPCATAPLRRTSVRPASIRRCVRAMATASTELRLSTAVPSVLSDTAVFVGSKQRLLSPAVIALVGEASAVWPSLVESAFSADAGGTASTWLPALAGGKARKLGCAVLPSACSRHNSPAQPHAVASLVASLAGTGTATVVAVAPASHALATACALGRTLPLFSVKSPSKALEPTATDSNPVLTAVLLTENAQPAVSAPALATLQAACDAVRFAGRLVDTPPEEMSTTHLRAEARRVAEALGARVSYHEIVGEQLRDQGFGGIWGVGKAAMQPPALVVLSYTPDQPDGQPAVAMVGKGIVYDTGGLSIKVGGGMVGMKCDMAGAAAILAAFQAAVISGCPRPLHAVLCLAENAIGPGAFRNDDVLRLFSGKTVEINNTDAEGRLVLGDGVAYASQKLSPGLIIDMATLTGAQLVATGKRHGAVVANSEALERLAVEAGLFSGDLVHPLPYCPEFFRPEFKSVVADMRNSVKDRSNAQSSCAANFVSEHLAPDYQGGWLHVDIAGPAWIADRGTGFGVGLLLALLQLPSLR